MTGKEVPKMEDAGEGPDLWLAAAHNPIPDDAWEYQIRKSLNDAAYQGLQFVPYCSTMPVQEKCDEPKYMWRKKVAGGGGRH